MASNIDPTHPVEGPAETQAVRDNFQVTADEITELQAAMAMAMPRGGGRMDGPLYLQSDPVDAADDSSDFLATTKHYVDMIDNLKQNTWGVTDGGDASPGDIGAYLSVSNVVGLSMTANVATSVCTISLPPGCFEVWGSCDFEVTGIMALAGQPIQPNQIGASISTHSDSLPTEDDLIIGTGVMNLIYSPLAAGQRQVLFAGTCRSNSSSPLDLYLVAQIGLGNVNVKGYISARRVR